jgi:thiol-disulfide isomerase/thioredoxin
MSVNITWRRLSSATLILAGLIAIQLPRPSAAADSKSTKEPGEKQWEQVVEANSMPPPPEGWYERTPSPKDFARFHEENGRLARRGAEKAREFYRRFPDSPHAREARVQEKISLTIAADLGDQVATRELQQLAARSGKEPPLTEDELVSIAAGPLKRLVDLLEYQVNPVDVSQMEHKARLFRQQYPKRPEGWEYLVVVMNNYLYYGRYPQARALAQDLTKADVPEETRDPAQALLRKLERLDKPLAIQFTALDGRKVDLAALRGKVVLVDFWATWCPPCMREIPRLRKLSDRYRAQGFEIVGISADDDEKAVRRVIDEHNMKWPIFFDGKGEDNRLVAEFEARPLPTLWLVDRGGRLRDLSGAVDLEAKIKKLLAEANSPR